MKFLRSNRLQLLHILFVNVNIYLLQSVTTKEGDSFRTETTLGTDKSIRLYEFTDTGMIVVRENVCDFDIYK
jgi:hypothetical protein